MAPSIRLTDETVIFNGTLVGRYALDENDEKTVVFYKPLFRIKNSYSLSVALYHEVDSHVDGIYVGWKV